MADKLTPQQEQAVHNRGGKLLVSAAAGSGKTKVLVDRLMAYLTDEHDPANLDDFLIITYTKAAAAELRGKIAAKLSQRIAEEPENKHLQKQMQRLFLAKIFGWRTTMNAGKSGSRYSRIYWTRPMRVKMTRISGPLWIRRDWAGMTVWCPRSLKKSTTAPDAT